MFTPHMRLRDALASFFFTAALAVTLTTSGASAATLQVTSFGAGDYAGAQAALAAFRSGTDGWGGANKQVNAVRTENFENMKAWDGSSGDANPTTAVGAFTSLGGRGSGASSIAGGAALQVRSDDPWVWGRHNASGVDGKWLDSNDTLGMRWDVGGLTQFNSVAFLLTDVADVGGKFSIKVGDTLFSNLLGASGRLANGSIQLVRILLPASVSGLRVELFNDRLNDGFGIDGATVASVAPVPLPPAILLLASGGAALFGVSRRRRRAAA